MQEEVGDSACQDVQSLNKLLVTTACELMLQKQQRHSLKMTLMYDDIETT